MFDPGVAGLVGFGMFWVLPSSCWLSCKVLGSDVTFFGCIFEWKAHLPQTAGTYFASPRPRGEASSS